MSSPIKEPDSFTERANKLSATAYYVLASFGLIVPILTSQAGIPLTWVLLIITAIVAVIIIYSTYDKKASVAKYAKYVDGQVEIEKQKQSVASGKVFWDAQKPNLDSSAIKGLERNARNQAYLAAIEAIKDMQSANEDEKPIYDKIIGTLEAMRRGSRSA